MHLLLNMAEFMPMKERKVIGWLWRLMVIMSHPNKKIHFNNSKPTKHWNLIQANRFKPFQYAVSIAMLCIWWDQKSVIAAQTRRNGYWWSLPTTNDQFESCIDRQTTKITQKTRKCDPAPWQRKGPRRKTGPRHHKSADLGASTPPSLLTRCYLMFRSMASDFVRQDLANFVNLTNWIDNWIAAKRENLFKDAFHKLPNNWQKVITSDGNYL